MSPRRLLACVAALATAPGFAASGVDKVAEPVALTFDWGDSFRARVESTRSRERVPADPRTAAPATQMNYLLDARRQAEGSYDVKSLDPQIGTVEVITEPDSLKLHHLLSRKVSAVTVQKGGQPKTVTQTETRELRYTHPD